MLLPLSQSDVQSQLSAWPAWVDTRKGGGAKRSRQRFEGYSNARDYWALRLDQLPGFGYRAMSDVEYRTWSSGQQFKLESGRVVRGVWATEEEVLGHPELLDHPTAIASDAMWARSEASRHDTPLPKRFAAYPPQSVSGRWS